MILELMNVFLSAKLRKKPAIVFFPECFFVASTCTNEVHLVGIFRLRFVQRSWSSKFKLPVTHLLLVITNSRPHSEKQCSESNVTHTKWSQAYTYTHTHTTHSTTSTVRWYINCHLFATLTMVSFIFPFFFLFSHP